MKSTEIVIYEKSKTRVYIDKCRKSGKKTFIYTIRKDSDYGIAELLGLIRWNGAWRQYCFYPEPNTLWSSGCLQGIEDFLTEINSLHNIRKKIKW